MERALPARDIASCLVELELQNPREEVAGIWRVAGDMIFRTGVEAVCCTLHGRDNALILQTQVGPTLVVIGWRNRAIEDAPAPFVDQQSKWQERNLVDGLAQQ